MASVPVTVKRSQFQTFMNVAASGAANYALIGDGVTSGVINYNPQTLEETYIHQNSGSTEVESYRPQFPLEQTCKKGDAVFDFVEAMRRKRAVLGEAKTDIVLVYLYETAVSGAFPAERQNVSIAVDDYGGDGGASNKINYTINFVGDAVQGTFNPTTRAFTATP